MDFKCFICGNYLKKNGYGSHLRGCSKKNKINMNKDDLLIKLYEYNLNIKITEEFIREYYLDKEYSLPDMLNEFKLNSYFVQMLLKKFNIKIRNIKDSNKLNSRQTKYKRTCLEKYGVENISQLNDVKEKKKQTFLKNYGVDNIRKSKQFRLWLNDHMYEKYGQFSVPNINNNANYFGWKTTDINKKEIRIKATRDGYKKWYNNLTDDEKQEKIKFLGRASKKFWGTISEEEKNFRINNLLSTTKTQRGSKLELKIIEALEKLQISYTRFYIINNKEFDILINKTNVLIEINGDYWHANPKKYKENDLIKYPGKKGFCLAKDIWKYDELKNQLATSNGFDVVYMWEHDINNNKNLMSFISDILLKKGIDNL